VDESFELGLCSLLVCAAGVRSAEEMNTEIDVGDNIPVVVKRKEMT